MPQMPLQEVIPRSLPADSEWITGNPEIMEELHIHHNLSTAHTIVPGLTAQLSQC